MPNVLSFYLSYFVSSFSFMLTPTPYIDKHNEILEQLLNKVVSTVHRQLTAFFFCLLRKKLNKSDKFAAFQLQANYGGQTFVKT